jgi:hypothetical protein
LPFTIFCIGYYRHREDLRLLENGVTGADLELYFGLESALLGKGIRLSNIGERQLAKLSEEERAQLEKWQSRTTTFEIAYTGDSERQGFSWSTANPLDPKFDTFASISS